ncbi:MAG: 4Fe-4S binding protein [Spirochaetales bacterium]|nr:4Fe-4S binding protein [Spirochaetales bacterium]
MEYIKTKKSLSRSAAYSLITVLYFAAGFINITLAALGLICMIIPFVLVFRDRKQTWCNGVCPRAEFLGLTGKFLGAGRKAPGWLLGDKGKRTVLMYFCMNIMFIMMSTMAVTQGMIDPIDRVRFLILFEFPASLPQLLPFDAVSDTLIHFSYRLYSIMFTSTVIGLGMSLYFRPKSWCAICPVKTMTASVVKGLNP